MQQLHKLRLLLLLGGCLFFLNRCFEPQKGCLDINAVNFSAAADEDCDEKDNTCKCVYPVLNFQVSQVYDTLPYLQNGLYLNALQQRFRIKDVAFYLSDFQVFQDGQSFVVPDTVRLKVFGNTSADTLQKTFRDDIILVRRNKFDYPIGDFRQDGIFKGVNFRLGLSDSVGRVVPRLAPTAHPLYTQPDSLWHGNSVGYIFAQVVIVRDTMAATQPDTISFSRADLGDIFIQDLQEFYHVPGYNFTIKLEVDYAKLFSGIDWTTGTPATWKAQIVTNWPNVFTLSQ